jgi:Reverse transcriptase (RNA-dependent DNA polymerase)
LANRFLGLSSAQVDYVTAFVQSPMEDDVYIEMPRGFKEDGKILKLKRSLYGLRQAPLNWFNYFKGNLEKVGLEQLSDVDPCLFVSDKVICLTYVDDTLLWSPKPEYIDEVMNKFKNECGLDLEKESDGASFLGVHIEINQLDNSIILTQNGLAQRIWLRSHLNDNTVVVPIRSEDQKADILTKGLKATKFVEIRKLLCGW